MGVLKFSVFGGEVPRLTKRDLPDERAQIAENLMADTPEFRPLNTDFDPNVSVVGVAAGVDCKTLYRYPTNSTTPLGTNLMMSIVRSPVVDDQYDRVYGSVLSGEAEYAPVVLSSGATNTPIQGASLRPLGVKYPTGKLTLSKATVDEAFLTPWEAANYERSLLDQIKSIVSGALEPVLWNPAFNLTGMPAFREYPSDTGKGVYQRIWTNSTPGSTTPTWNTYNGTPVSNHLWTLEIVNPAWVTEGASRTYYANFQAKVLTWRIKSNVSAETVQLQALVLPGTTDRVLSDSDITALWATLRSVLPDDPTATASTDLRTLLARYQAEYLTLVNHLDQGFTGDVTPQAGYQIVSKALYDLQASVDGITSFYDKLARQDFDAAVIAHFKSKFTGNLPEGETELVEPRYYTYTLVNDRGEESKPYWPGDGNADADLPLIEVNQAQAVTVTRPALPASVGANDHITHWRLYRSAAGSSAAGYLFVAEVPVGTTTYVDLRRTDSLNEPLPTTTWFPPPTVGASYLKHLVSMPGGFMAGFLGNTVYFCEPLHPYAWPPDYAIPVNGGIVALGVFGVTLVVLTTRGPVYISGSVPGSMSTVVLESNEVCQSPRSVVPISGGVLFASQNGLCLASQDGVRVLTEQLWTKKEWQALEPEKFICEEMNGVVYMSHGPGLVTAALHIPSMKLVRMDLSVTAFYSDFHTGELFAALPAVTTPVPQPPKVIKLLEGSALRTARWRSKRILLEKETGFVWLRVEGQQSVSAPLMVDLYGYLTDDTGTEVEYQLHTALSDGTHSAVVTDTRPVRVEAGRFKDFEVEVEGACRVTSLQLTSTTVELQRVN